ncbi:MAG: 23S rRNA (pseudouridine(1915)-N(3))-methyltransferase RlmH [Pseudomonadota bacterium]
MKVYILAVGEQKSGPEQTLTDDYCKRFERSARSLGFTGINQIIVKSGGGIAKEGERLVSRLPNKAHTIRLDEHGKSISSKALADRLSHLRDDGVRELVFLIGGAEGYSEDVKAACPETMALGPQTWPHLLVRAMISEQLYRAATIIAGNPYHKA